MEEELEQRIEQNDFVDLANCTSKNQIGIYLDIFEKNIDPFSSRESIEKLGNEIVKETDYWWVIRNKFYKDYKNRFLVISKRFMLSIEELTPNETINAFTVFTDLKKEYKIQGGGLLFRFGETRLSGSSVKRLHFHIVEPNESCPTPLWLGCKIKPSKKRRKQ